MTRSASVCLCLIVATFAVYVNVLDFQFVDYDDPDYVVENESVHQGLSFQSVQWAFTSGDASNWHPLTWLSHMLDCQLFGLDRPGRHHLTSLLLHVTNTVLMFLVLQRMTGALWPPALVAAIFALHPLHVESVAWVSERKDVLSTMFWLLCIASYVEYTQRGRWRWYVLAVVLLAMGLLAKPMLVTTPFVLLLLDYWPLDRLAAGRKAVERIVEKIPMFLLVAASSVVTYYVQQAGGSMTHIPLSHRLANAVVAYVRYMGKTFWPQDLSVFYPNRVWMWQPWQILGALALLLVVTALVVILRRQRYLTVGWLWYLGTLVPVIGIVQVGKQSMADRYTYITMTGLLIMITWGAAGVCKRWPAVRILAALAATGAIVSCLWLTTRQVEKWRDSYTLYSHAIAVTELNYVIHYNLGNVLYDEGRLEEAIHHYRQVVRINPRDVQAYNNLGCALGDTGQQDAAILQFREALRLDPNHASSRKNLAIVLGQRSEH